MGSKQTALEWLKVMLEWNYGDPQMLEMTWENLDDLFEQAKAMEKEQIMKAYYEGTDTRYTPEQYYNETYDL